MKRKWYLFALVALFGMGVMAGCDTTGEEDPSIYSISYQEGEYYEVTNLAEEGQAGSNILFNVESTSIFYVVDEVKMNGETLTEGSLGYSFIMPEEDVEISVFMAEAGEYDDLNDHLAWGDSVTGVLSTASKIDQEVSREVTQDIPLSFPGISSGNWISSIKEDIQTSNSEVIPQEAISFKPIKASNSSAIIGGRLVVDLKQIQPGETYIYVHLDPNNSSLGTLMRKFTVVEYGTLELETFSVTLSFENRSSYEDSQLFINLRDNEYVYGFKEQETRTIYLSDLENKKYTFDYVKNHTYFISCGVLVEGEYTGIDLEIDDWVGEGSSSSGFNQIQNSTLTLIKEGIEAVVTLR